MRMLLSTTVILLLLTFNACASGSMHLRAVVVDREATIYEEDIDDLYLKFDSQDNQFFAVIVLNTKGQEKMRALMDGNIGKELQLYSGQKLLIPGLPIHTERVDSIMVKFKEDREAIEFLKASTR
jgi:preprotein translocase subunit SecD